MKDFNIQRSHEDELILQIFKSNFISHFSFYLRLFHIKTKQFYKYIEFPCFSELF